MCGITGIIRFDQKPVEKRDLEKMSATLNHRGPDDGGVFVSKNVGLAHRRLSIIDLSRAGHQPMTFGDLTIVFNGEIYNYIEIRQELIKKGHKFKSQSDTEVILVAYKEWGEKCLEKFNGMWAFALYDLKKKTLFCARDRLGVKPFYYFIDKNRFVFASEAKAILPVLGEKPDINEQIVWDFLFCGYLDHSRDTFFKKIKELRGGHYLIIKNAKMKITKYWGLNTNNCGKQSDQEASKFFLSLLQDSVKLRLRSDVPIGTCLSGGLDSSAIVCLINDYLKKAGKSEQIGQWQKTFSACYDRKKYPGCDERPFIDTVVKKTKARSFKVFPQGSKLSQEISDLLYHQDFPFGSTSIYAQWNVFRLARDKKVKVVLDGQGSDELLAGYHTFFPVYFQSLKKQGKYFTLIRELISYSRVHHQSLKKVIMMNFQTPFLKRIFRRSGLNLKNVFYGSYYDYSVFNQEWRNKFQPFNLPRPNNDPFLDQSYLLTTAQGLPSLLRYEDRNSMAFSIESRTPFLDYRLVEFIYSLPQNQKIRGGQTKWVMRQALKNVIPEKIRNRQDKIGFATPEEIWFKKILAPEMKKVFASEKFAERKFFDSEKVVDSFDKFLNGEPIMYQLFWRIYILELWMRRFVD